MRGAPKKRENETLRFWARKILGKIARIFECFHGKRELLVTLTKLLVGKFAKFPVFPHGNFYFFHGFMRFSKQFHVHKVLSRGNTTVSYATL